MRGSCLDLKLKIYLIGYNNVQQCLNYTRYDINFDELVDKISKFLSDIKMFRYYSRYKSISDLINIYAKENLINQRNEIIKQLEKNDIGEEESKQLGQILNEIIIKLAKMK